MNTDLSLQRRDVNSYKSTFQFMLRHCKQLSEHENPFVGEMGAGFLLFAVTTRSLDVAYDLLKQYPEIASTTPPDNLNPLAGLGYMGIALDLVLCYPELASTPILDAYPPLLLLAHQQSVYLSAKRYNFYQRFIYTRMPAEIYGLEDAIKYKRFTDQIYQGTYFQSNLFTKSFVYYVMERIYAKFWKVALHVPHIKQLHQDKVEHTLALTILKIMCEEICKSKSNHVEQLYYASVVGMLNDIPEVIELTTQVCPQLVWARNSLGFSLVRHSIMFRCKNSFNFLKHQVPSDKYFHIASSDDDGNNLLHVAGKLDNKRSLDMGTGANAALKMQRDMQWFQEVYNFVRLEERTTKNFKEETPFMLFKKEHKDLRLEGVAWVKKAARSYTISAAFVFAIVLAAAFTVPGGSNGDARKAGYETRVGFIIFVVSDVMSLITSATSLLLFRSFDTASYEYEDFLYNLPKLIIHGLVMLLMSVTTMLIAFGATLYIMVVLESSRILFLTVAITCLPNALYVTLQLPLLVKLISSTYGRGIFGK